MMYGVMLYDIGGNGQEDVAFGNAASIIETRTAARVAPIHYGVNYHGSPLQFKLIFGSTEELDRYDLERISLWLTGYQDYQWLTIDQPDLENVQFRCIVTQLRPLSVGWLPYAFEAQITCDCPYAYSYPFSVQYTLNGESNIVFRNDGSAREYLRPTLSFTSSGGTDGISIINEDDGGREFAFSSLPTGSGLIVDNQNGIITGVGTSVNLYTLFNMRFLRLVPGDNHLRITGYGTLTLSGRFYHNTAG